jgi:hypothetical protein
VVRTITDIECVGWISVCPRRVLVSLTGIKRDCDNQVHQS